MLGNGLLCQMKLKKKKKKKVGWYCSTKCPNLVNFLFNFEVIFSTYELVRHLFLSEGGAGDSLCGQRGRVLSPIQSTVQGMGEHVSSAEHAV